MTRPRDTDPPLVWAEYYITEHGWGLSHFAPGTKGPSDEGWNTPTAWVDTVDKARAHWSAHPTHGVGVIHAASGTVAIDIDHVEHTRRVFREFGMDIDRLIANAPRIRGAKEGRDKALFRAPDGDALARRAAMWKHPSDKAQSVTLFELRAGAVHDCLPPSQHPDGHRYEWRVAPWDLKTIPPLPDDLLAFWREWDALREQIARLAPWAEPFVPPAVSGRPRSESNNNIIGEFNRAYSVDVLLQANGYQKRGKRYLAPSSKSRIPGVVVLDDGRVYSHHGTDVLADTHAHDVFDLFCLFEHRGDVKAAVRAAASMVDVPLTSAAPVIDFAELLAATKRPRLTDAERPRFPQHLLEVPGLVGDLADYINQTARYPQPVLALAAALSAAATLMGRKVRTESDLRTNMYVLGVAEAGAGKEHARQAIRTIFDYAGAFRRVAVEGLASDAALNTALVSCPSSLFLLDEIGRFLAVLNDPRASSHLSEIITQLLKVYSAATGPYCGKVYADAERNQVVQQPNLSIYGTTAPHVFYESLTTAQIEDGFLSRLVVFESEDADPEPRDVIAAPPPQSLIDACAAWEQVPENANPQAGNVEAITRPSPRIVSPDPAARVLLSRFEREMRERRQQLRAANKPAALYVRTAATAQKLALIRAAGRSIESAIIDADDARWGCELALALADSMAWRVLANVAENTVERNVKRVAEIIRKAGAEGIGRSQLTRKTQWLTQAARDDVLKTLVEASEVFVKHSGTATRSSERYWWSSYAQEGLNAPDTSNPSNPSSGEFEGLTIAKSA